MVFIGWLHAHTKNDTTVYLKGYTKNKIFLMEDRNSVDFKFLRLKQIKIRL